MLVFTTQYRERHSAVMTTKACCKRALSGAPCTPMCHLTWLLLLLAVVAYEEAQQPFTNYLVRPLAKGIIVCGSHVVEYFCTTPAICCLSLNAVMLLNNAFQTG